MTREEAESRSRRAKFERRRKNRVVGKALPATEEPYEEDARRDHRATIDACACLVGRTIVRVELNPFSDERAGGAGVAYDPSLILDDGTLVRFVVQETEVGEYGAVPRVHPASRKPAR